MKRVKVVLRGVYSKGCSNHRQSGAEVIPESCRRSSQRRSRTTARASGLWSAADLKAGAKVQGGKGVDKGDADDAESDGTL